MYLIALTKVIAIPNKKNKYASGIKKNGSDIDPSERTFDPIVLNRVTQATPNKNGVTIEKLFFRMCICLFLLIIGVRNYLKL